MFFEEVFFKKRVQAVGIGFSGCRRGGCPARQLDYITTARNTCQQVFSIFLTNFDRDFWAGCIWGYGDAAGTNCGDGKVGGR